MEKTQSVKLSTYDVVMCSLFVALITVGAFIKIMIPIGPFSVTFSLQIMFTVMAGLLLGRKKATLTLTAYLVLGLAGVPVFAHGGGLGYIARPTFGFLIGFLAAAFVCGSLQERVKKTGFAVSAVIAFAGELAYYICGLVYYYVMFNFVLSNGLSIGINELIRVWCLSTILPDYLLCILAVFLSERLRKMIGKI